jgi:glutamine phosphoribosylpyrophosphate amidotransferase
VVLGYKESPVAEARRRFGRRVGLLFADFFSVHRSCLDAATAGDIDLVMPVPSSSRPGPASLERVEGLVDLSVSVVGSGAIWSPQVLRRAAGAIGHMRPDAQAFAVTDASRSALKGARVLLLDDIYVSGARAQSAAAALRHAGATSVLIVPLGRAIRPARIGRHALFLARQPTENGHGSRCVVARTGV